jgi:hypothetical protein
MIKQLLLAHVACVGDTGNANKIILGKPEGKTHLRGTGIWEENIKVDLRGTAWEDLEWICLVQDTLQW